MCGQIKILLRRHSVSRTQKIGMMLLTANPYLPFTVCMRSLGMLFTDFIRFDRSKTTTKGSKMFLVQVIYMIYHEKFLAFQIWSNGSNIQEPNAPSICLNKVEERQKQCPCSYEQYTTHAGMCNHIYIAFKHDSKNKNNLNSPKRLSSFHNICAA